MISYECEVYTRDIPSAGTDSKITLTLYGENGQFEVEDLTSFYTGEPFEQSQLDCCTLKNTGDLGAIYRIDIKSDHTGGAPSWALGYIQFTRIDEKGTKDKVTKFEIPENIKIDNPSITYSFMATSGYFPVQ